MFEHFLKRKHKERILGKIVKQSEDKRIEGVIIYEDLYENCLKVSASEEKVVQCFSELDAVRINLLKEGTEFIFQGFIHKKHKLEEGTMLHIRVSEMKSFPDVRKSKRFMCEAKIAIADCTGIVTFGYLHDIGYGGALLVTEKPIATEGTIAVDIFTSTNEIINFKAAVLRSLEEDNLYEYAVKIYAIDGHNRKLLNKLLDLLELSY